MRNLLIFFTVYFLAVGCQEKAFDISGDIFDISFPNSANTLWAYRSEDGTRQNIAPPVFQINGQEVKGVFQTYTTEERIIDKINVREYIVRGNLASMPEITMAITLRVAPDNPIVRFRYSLSSEYDIYLTKVEGKDQLNYLFTSLNDYDRVTEITLSEFFELEHSFLPVEITHYTRSFENEISCMGPIMVASNTTSSLLLTYEHGSQLPDRFVEYRFAKDTRLAISAVKGNYFEGQSLKNGYHTLWMNIGIARGGWMIWPNSTGTMC
jgi:alpha-galactosidase